MTSKDSHDVLIIEEDGELARSIEEMLVGGGDVALRVALAGTLADAVAEIKGREFDIVLLDLGASDTTGLNAVKAVKDVYSRGPIVAMTPEKDDQQALDVVKLGCQDYLHTGDLNPQMLRRVIRYSIERHAIEQALEASRYRFERYANMASDWFWEMGPDFRFTGFSDRFEEMTGISPDEFIGQTMIEIGATAPVNVNWSHHLRGLRQNKPFEKFEFAYMTRTEDLQWFRVSGEPVFGEDGTFRGFDGIGTDITLEKYGEWELRQSKTLVDGILFTSLDGFMVLTAIRDQAGDVADFKFTHFNKRAEEILGRTKKSLLGKLLRSEMPHMVDHGLLERAAHTVKTGATFDVEHFYDWERMRGWFRLVGAKLEDSVVITFSDISSHKEADRQQRLAAAVFNTSIAGMMVTDETTRIIAVNPAFTHITGYTKDDVLGKKLEDLGSRQRSMDFYEDLLSRINSAGSWAGEIWNKHKDGRVRVHHQAISVVRNTQGAVTNYVAVLDDVTERKAADIALAEKTRELERSNADLQQFAYVSSHDLREPLRMVSSYLQLLVQRYGDALDGEAHEYIDFAVDGAKRMDSLIRDLLQYSRVETHGKDFSDTDSEEVLEDALDNLQAALTEAGGVVTFKDLPRVTADPSQLLQLFQNLVGNALKYRAEDRLPEISVKAESSDGMVTYTVRDNGIGIDPQYFERIFVIFQRLHGREEYGGTGIGLSVCKRIVERHGGAIWVESEPGAGSTFYFSLPAAE